MIHDLFLLPFSDCAFGNGRIDHLMDLLNNLMFVLNRYYKDRWFIWKFQKAINAHEEKNIYTNSWQKTVYVSIYRFYIKSI